MPRQVFNKSKALIINQATVNQACLVLSFFTFLYAKLTDVNELLVVSLSIQLFIVFFDILCSKKINSDRIIFAIVFIILLIFFSTSLNFDVTRLYYTLIALFLSVLLGFSLRGDVELVKKTCEKSLILIYLGLTFSFYLSYLESLPLHIFLELKVLSGFSYNYISGYIVLLTALHLASSYKLRRSPIDIWFFPLASLLFCFFLFGRSGIGLSIFNLLLFILFFASRKYVPYIFVVLVTLLCILVINIDLVMDFINLTKFSEGLNTPRYAMLIEYFEMLDARSLMFGVDLYQTDVIKQYDLNPHNSFLYLHSAIGFLGILFIIWLSIMLLKKELAILFFLTVYLARGATDIIIFPSVIDPLFFTLLFYNGKSRPVISPKNRSSYK